MIVTSRLLRLRGACREQLKVFVDTFGEKVRVTRKKCMRAASIGLSASWAAENILPPRARTVFRTSRIGITKKYLKDRDYIDDLSTRVKHRKAKRKSLDAEYSVACWGVFASTLAVVEK